MQGPVGCFRKTKRQILEKIVEDELAEDDQDVGKPLSDGEFPPEETGGDLKCICFRIMVLI